MRAYGIVDEVASQETISLLVLLVWQLLMG